MELIKKTLVLIFGNGFNQIINLLIVVMLSRTLTIYDYASYRQSTLIVMTLLPLITFGIPTSLSYFLPRAKDDEESKRILYQSYFTLILFALIGFIIVYFSSGFFSTHYQNPHLQNTMKIYSIFLFFEASTKFFTNYLISTNRSRKLMILTPLFTLVKLLAVIIYLVFFNNNILVLLTLLTIASFIVFIIVNVEIKTYYKRTKLSIKIDSAVNQLVYSLPIGLSLVIATLSYQLDNNMVSLYFTPEQFAIFTNGAVEIPLITLITGSITSIILPEFSKIFNSAGNDNRKVVELWKNAAFITSSVLIPLMFILLVFGEGFISLLYSDKYLQSTPIFKIYLLILPIRAVNFSTILIASGNQKKVLVNSFITLTVNILLNITFIKLFGIYGAALATVVSTYTLAGLQMYQLIKVLNTNIIDIYPWKKVALMALVSVGILIPFFILAKVFMMNNIIELIVFGGSCLVIVYVVLIKLKIISIDSFIKHLKVKRN